MSKQVLTNATLLLDACDVSGDHNAVAYQYEADAVDVTVLNSGGTRARLPGLKQFSASMAGFFEAGTGKINDEHFNAIGATNQTVMTLVPGTIAEGSPAMFGSLVSTSYAPGASIGEALKFAVAMQGSGDLALGTVLHAFAGRTTSGSGTVFNLGAVPTGKSVRMAVHLVSLSGGGSIQIKLESAALVGFGSPTNRLGPVDSAVPVGQLVLTAGPITDAFWRVTWTFVGGSSPSAAFYVAVSIQ